MKILILANHAVGVYNFRKELPIALVAAGHEVFVSMPEHPLRPQVEALGVKYIPTPVDRRGSNPLRDIALYFRYRSLLRKIRPDVVLTYTVKPNIYGNLAARGRIPVISTITGLGEGFSRSGMVGGAVRFLYRLAFRHVQCVIFQNTASEEAMRAANIIKNQRILHVPGSGVNLEEYSPLPYPQDDTVNFLYVGRIKKDKGLCELIAAAEQLHIAHPRTFTLTCIGFLEGDIDEEFDKAVQNGTIIYIGHVDDVTPYLQAAHCVVLPSYSEGMSNALLEAAASARPLVATDIPGCREVLTDGVNGYLCKPREINSLYQAMLKMLHLTNFERETMGIAGRHKVEQCFDRQIVTDAVTTEIYGCTLTHAKARNIGVSTVSRSE